MKLTTDTVRRLAIALFLLCSHLSSSDKDSYEVIKQSGPKSLVIAYRCSPQNRIALRDSMIASGVKRFHEWEQQGVLQNFQILFNRYADSESWDMLAVLSFKSAADLAGWAEIEREFTAGLDQGAMRLVSSVATYSMDLASSGSAPVSEQHQNVFMVIPYTLDVTPDEYFNYVQGYVEPQLKGWMNQGILTRWSLFINRYFPGRPWQSLLILQYQDEAALGQRDKVIAKTRAQLASNPSWKAFSDKKQQVRRELQIVIAEAL